MTDYVLRAETREAAIAAIAGLPPELGCWQEASTDINGNAVPAGVVLQGAKGPYTWFATLTGTLMVPQRPAGWSFADSAPDKFGDIKRTWTPNGPIITASVTTGRGVRNVPLPQPYDTGFWIVLRWLGGDFPVPMPAALVPVPLNTINPDMRAGLTLIA